VIISGISGLPAELATEQACASVAEELV
jgi:hypothetical protein